MDIFEYCHHPSFWAPVDNWFPLQNEIIFKQSFFQYPNFMDVMILWFLITLYSHQKDVIIQMKLEIISVDI